jgi:uncharacterized membrane protein
MNWKIKNEIVPLMTTLLMGILAFIYYPTLPKTIPSHFDKNGLPDKFASKSQVFLIYLGLVVFLYLLFTFLPMIDPFWKRIRKRYGLLLLFRDFILIFFLYTYVLLLYSAESGKLQTHLFVAGLGFLFVLIGNYLPKIPRNFFFGVRTPWALASEMVWRKTHILSGWFFATGGILIITLSLLKIGTALVILAVFLPFLLFSTVIYPYRLYRKLQKEGKLENPAL